MQAVKKDDDNIVESFSFLRGDQLLSQEGNQLVGTSGSECPIICRGARI